MSKPSLGESRLSFEQEKWAEEVKLRARELDVKEAEQRQSRWSSPLVLAILGAAIAGLGNAGVALLNGSEQRSLEESRAQRALDIQRRNNNAQQRVEDFKSESARILEAIKAKPDQAAKNLEFLIEVGLIRDKAIADRITTYLNHRTAGQGPSLASYTSFEFRCGTERWPVKVGTDQDAAEVDLKPETKEISELVAFSPPVLSHEFDDQRYDIEKKTFTVSGKVSFFRPERDGDYHIVLSDAMGRTMIVEAANPKCAENSVFQTQIAAARKKIDDNMKQFLNSARIRVTGVAFFDSRHKQKGGAPNGIELHPILDVRIE